MGFPKDGYDSPGVARMYCGALGKRGNCQIGVSVNLVSDIASSAVDWRLFLPESWDDTKHGKDPLLGGRETGTPVARVPAGEILVVPQPVQPVSHPHAMVPFGLLDRAICAVRDGTCSPERERMDNGHLSDYIGLRNSPEHAR
ncbi:transposase [Streptomyces sp. NBC_00842]|uniref:transposase n=1 Tax=unclassified Streptomyces TaxID=2593676 RepID=UPI00386CE8E6